MLHLKKTVVKLMHLSPRKTTMQITEKRKGLSFWNKTVSPWVEYCASFCEPRPSFISGGSPPSRGQSPAAIIPGRSNGLAVVDGECQPVYCCIILPNCCKDFVA